MLSGEAVRTNARIRGLWSAFSVALAVVGCSPGVLIEAPPTGPTGTGGDGGAGGEGAGGEGAGASGPASCEGAMVLADGQDLSHHIALDATHVYWTTDGLTSSVERTPKCGGAIETLYEGPDFVDIAQSLAVDDTTVYWVGGLGNGDWGVRSIPKGGGALTDLAGGFDQVGSIAIDGDHVYFASNCGGDEVCIQRVSKTGGTVTTMAAGLSSVVDLTLDATHVYWIGYPAYGQIMRTPKAGGPVEELSWMQEQPQSLAVDDQFVYVAATKDSVDVHVVKVPLAGAPEPTILVSNVHGSPGDIAVDATHVYYAVGPALDGPRAIFEVPKTGGTPAEITPTQSWPYALAVDDTAVYFTNDTWQGNVKRAPK